MCTIHNYFDLLLPENHKEWLKQDIQTLLEELAEKNIPIDFDLEVFMQSISEFETNGKVRLLHDKKHELYELL